MVAPSPFATRSPDRGAWPWRRCPLSARRWSPLGAGASRAPELRAAMPPGPTFQTRRAPPPRPV